MRFLKVNGERIEATKGAKGVCPDCGSDVIAKCGPERVNHWSHLGRRDCDSWHETESEWHRAWKDKFPPDWQEITHHAEDGEIHRADVKTNDGWVLEFQRSIIKPEERKSRNEFYKKLIWVVYGLERKKDAAKFQEALEEWGTAINGKPFIKHLRMRHECKLLKEWTNDKSFVFFDFEESNFTDRLFLWLLLPTNSHHDIYLTPVTHDELIESLINNEFEMLINQRLIALKKGVAEYQSFMNKQCS